MENDRIARICQEACSIVARRYRRFKLEGGEVLAVVFENVNKAVERNRQDRGNEIYVRSAATRQAHREFRQLLSTRPSQIPEDFSNAKSLGERGLDIQNNTLKTVMLHELRSRLGNWVSQLTEEDKLLLRTLTGECTLAQTAAYFNVDTSTVWRRRSRFLELARRELQEIAP